MRLPKLATKLLIFVTTILTSASIASAQNLYYNIDFETFGQNREYNKIEFLKDRSATEFAACLAPSIGLNFEKNHSLNLGLNAISLFTNTDEPIIEDLDMILYYGFDNEHWSASAGIFPRSRMAIESYSNAFFRDDYLFFNNMVSGVMGQYRCNNSFAEFIIDYESQPSTTAREVFRMLSAGAKYWSNFMIGYNFSLTHYAGQEAEWMQQVVDNLLINPTIGYSTNTKLKFKARLGYLQSLQRDRTYGNKWLTPGMGEFGLQLSYCGIFAKNSIYIGENIEPLYNGHIAPDNTPIYYGDALYTGDECFRTEGGYYNKSSIGYNRTLLDGKLELKLEFITHFIKEGIASEQLISVKLNLMDMFKKSKNK